MPHRDDVNGKAQSVVIAASRLDQPPVLVVQVEEPFQLDPRVGAEPAVAALIDHARHEITDGQHRSPFRVLSAGSRADVPQPPVVSRWRAPLRSGVHSAAGSGSPIWDSSAVGSTGVRY